MLTHALRRTVTTAMAVVASLVVLASSTTVALPDDAVAAAAAPSCGPTRYKPDGSAWRCRFADGFGGRSLDRSRWQPVTTRTSGYAINRDCYFDSPRNIAVNRGTLRLTARRTSKPFTCKSPSGRYRSSYTAASLTTLGRFQQTHGQFEARIRFPGTRGPGTHSAWWLFPTSRAYGGWPWAGEIDIAEFYAQYPDRVVPQLHYVPRVDAGVASRSNYYCMISKPSDWHTYRLVWSPTLLTISYDGRTCLSYTLLPARAESGRSIAAGKPFDKPFTLNLTQGAGLGDNAPTAGTAFPATMVVDYVRAWS
ncbi:hypothetical protein ASD11_00005 [Aeromicrobium sp. Root495]|uniref:glycoside hydrolase family 16 protein n=1 Tax=Aeromicrobium sp. Root495 TaxID=1736550 RepID=UPI0006F47BAA|nr:glycoside hydrolase family 16 protein [Aeromicrobium sp. Root495]KQY58096.1 hypothetical protein ASD11_00005 [Aeromicrobium sp. Root495]